MPHQRLIDSTKTEQPNTARSHAATPRSVLTTAEQILQLQRTIGNNAVSSFLQPKLKLHAPEDHTEQDLEKAEKPASHNVPFESGFLTGAGFQIQRVARGPAGGGVGSPEQAPSAVRSERQSDDPTITQPLIVEDEATSLAAGQMRKSEFLDQLQAAVTVSARDATSGSEQPDTGSSEIERRISNLREQDSQQVEQSMRRYAPRATSARELLSAASNRIRSAAEEWKRTGEVPSASQDLLELGSGTGASGLVSGIGGAVSALAGGVASAVSSIFHKRKDGGTNGENNNPEQIRSQLGEGRSLDGGVRARMGAAFGHDFSHVRVHTDSKAAGLSENLNARAFTVGSDIAFGGEEYRPGTLIGDALIAHELAHVVQQAGGGSVGGGALPKGDSHGGDLEEDADLSAVGVMVRLWGGTTDLLKDVGHEALPRMRSGLKLQTCCQCRATPMSAAGSPLSLATLAELTPWQLTQISQEDLECAAGSPARGRPKVTDYVRARRLALSVITFDIDAAPGPGRDPSAEELAILDRDLSQLLATRGVQESMGDRGGHGSLPNAEGGTPTLRGRVRLATAEGMGAARYRLDKYLGTLPPGAEALQLGQALNIPQSNPIATPQERAVADYFKHAHAPPIANGLYQVQEDRIYVPEMNLTDPSNAFVTRHETAHLISGGERVRQAFIRRFGSQWLEWWNPFNEGMAELISIESLPQGQAPPPPPTLTTPGGVVVEGVRYEDYVNQMRTITADPAHRELFFRAFFTGDIPERVFELLAQVRNQSLPPPPQSSP